MANYLYNGIELPALPEWDKVTYPYAVIVLDNRNNVYKLFCLRSEGECNAKGGVIAILCDAFYNDNGQWADSSGVITDNVNTVVWANYDVYFRDSVDLFGGTLYLSATKPVPVQGKAKILKRAFWEGFLSGVGTIHKAQAQQEPEIIATFENGILYIKAAPATLKDGVLEVGKYD